MSFYARALNELILALLISKKKIPVPALDGNFDATTLNSMNKCDLNKDYCFNVSFELIP